MRTQEQLRLAAFGKKVARGDDEGASGSSEPADAGDLLVKLQTGFDTGVQDSHGGESGLSLGGSGNNEYQTCHFPRNTQEVSHAVANACECLKLCCEQAVTRHPPCGFAECH
jgi:hypothetical protein